MEPTVDHELARCRAVLRGLIDSGAFDGEVGAALAEVDRSLDMVGRSWAGRLPAAVADSTDLLGLLADLGEPELESLASAAEAAARAFDAVGAEEANAALRARLSVRLQAGPLPAATTARAATVLLTGLGRRPW